MIHSIYKIFLVLSLVSCKGSDAESIASKELNEVKEETSSEKRNTAQQEGYLFVDIAKIYHSGGELDILDMSGNSLATFKDKKVIIAGSSYDIIEESGKYSQHVKVESYFPEYGLFILRVVKQAEDKFEVDFNDTKAVIVDKGQNLLEYKTVEEYVMDGYPYPTKSNPLRIESNESSEIVDNFENHTYLSLEIVGDWLKVKDDKDCYSGEEPSPEDIIGWVRWRKDGKVILEIRHRC
jgi:hypothetical protein